MISFEEYKERYEIIYDIHDVELLKLSYLIDCRMEEAKGIVGSANRGVGYWIAEKLMWEGYRDTKALAAVFKEATYEAIKKMNEDAGIRCIPFRAQDFVAPYGKAGVIIDIDEGFEKIKAKRIKEAKEYLGQHDEKVQKETAKKIIKHLREKGHFTFDYPDDPAQNVHFGESIFEELEDMFGLEAEK